VFTDHRHHLAGFGKKNREKRNGLRKIYLRPKVKVVDKLTEINPDWVCIECQGEVTVHGYCDSCGTLNVRKRVISDEPAVPVFINFSDLSSRERLLVFGA